MQTGSGEFFSLYLGDSSSLSLLDRSVTIWLRLMRLTSSARGRAGFPTQLGFTRVFV